MAFAFSGPQCLHLYWKAEDSGSDMSKHLDLFRVSPRAGGSWGADICSKSGCLFQGRGLRLLPVPTHWLRGSCSS